MSDTPAGNGNARNIPALAPARRPSPTLDAVLDRRGVFDPDAWHVMNERDNALVADEILNGAGSAKFVYSFEIQGNKVEGISVIGARHMASIAGQLKHRIVASVSKTGALHVFTQYPGPDVQMHVNTALVHSLAAEEDYYEVLIEMTDLSNGNAIQARARESKVGYRRDGSPYPREHYDKIADAKAYRNAVTTLIRQDIQIKFRQDMLRLGKSEVITDSVLGEKRTGVLRYAARSGIPLNRAAVEALTMDQIAGMADAAREGRQPAFVQAATALGLLTPRIEGDTAPTQATGPAEPATASQARRTANRRQPPAAPAQEAQNGATGPREEVPPNQGDDSDEGEGSAPVEPGPRPPTNQGGGQAAPTARNGNANRQRTQDEMQASLIIADIERATDKAVIDGILRSTINRTLLDRWQREWPEGRIQVMSAASARKTALEEAQENHDE